MASTFKWSNFDLWFTLTVCQSIHLKIWYSFWKHLSKDVKGIILNIDCWLVLENPFNNPHYFNGVNVPCLLKSIKLPKTSKHLRAKSMHRDVYYPIISFCGCYWEIGPATVDYWLWMTDYQISLLQIGAPTADEHLNCAQSAGWELGGITKCCGRWALANKIYCFVVPIICHKKFKDAR